MNQFKPLPDDIQKMSEKETACQYCGISYLLLTKYEKMEAHVRSMESELQDLKKYVQERPGMLSRLNSLLNLQKESSQQVSNLERNITGLKQQMEWDRKDLASYQKKNHELNTELESQKSNLKDANELMERMRTRNKLQLNQLLLDMGNYRRQVPNKKFIQEMYICYF